MIQQLQLILTTMIGLNSLIQSYFDLPLYY